MTGKFRSIKAMALTLIVCWLVGAPVSPWADSQTALPKGGCCGSTGAPALSASCACAGQSAHSGCGEGHVRLASGETADGPSDGGVGVLQAGCGCGGWGCEEEWCEFGQCDKVDCDPDTCFVENCTCPAYCSEFGEPCMENVDYCVCLWDPDLEEPTECDYCPARCPSQGGTWQPCSGDPGCGCGHGGCRQNCCPGGAACAEANCTCGGNPCDCTTYCGAFDRPCKSLLKGCTCRGDGCSTAYCPPRCSVGAPPDYKPCGGASACGTAPGHECVTGGCERFAACNLRGPRCNNAPCDFAAPCDCRGYGQTCTDCGGIECTATHTGDGVCPGTPPCAQ